MICEDCIKELKNKLRRDDIMVLIALKEENAINNQFSMGRENIQKKAEMSIATTANSLMRLEAACFVERGLLGGKIHRYHITENGIKAIDLLEKEM